MVSVEVFELAHDGELATVLLDRLPSSQLNPWNYYQRIRRLEEPPGKLLEDRVPLVSLIYGQTSPSGGPAKLDRLPAFDLSEFHVNKNGQKQDEKQ